MCFVKKQENTDKMSYHTCSNYPYCCNTPEYVSTQYLPFYNLPFIATPPMVQSTPLDNSMKTQLQAILGRLRGGNQAILSTLHVLQENENQLTQALNDITEIQEETRRRMTQDEHNSYIPEKELIPFKSSSLIIRKIFGNQHYKYRIRASLDFPKIIYKCRNILIPVQLTTRRGDLVRNGNLIHLCLAVCNENGKWILGQDGESFVKGKVEVDLYRGEAELKKIYPSDISRSFPGGKINLVIYPRSSVLSNPERMGKGEHLIDSSQIQPLLIHNITIKSKKKPAPRQ